MKSSKIN